MKKIMEIGMGIWEIIKGVGVKVISERITKKKTKDKKDLSSLHQKIVKDIIVQKSAKDKLTDRLNGAIKILNGKSIFPHLNIEQITEDMRVNTTGEIEDYFKGIKEPSQNWLNQFSQTYHINENWLRKGRGKIFSHLLINYNKNIASTFEKIIDYNPDKILFIKENGADAKCNIVLLKKDKPFRIIQNSSNWRMSSNTDSTGRKDTYGYYRIVQEVLNHRTLFYRSNGYIISDADFQKLNEGSINPKTYFNNDTSIWFEYLSDFKHEKNSKEFYAQWGGASFFEAQEVIQYEKTKWSA